MQNFKTTLKITGALMITILTWSSAFVAIRAGLKGYHPVSMALLRYLIASVCMFALYFRSAKQTKITGKEVFLLCVLGLLGFTIYNIALNYGEISVPAGISSFIICLMPVFVVILAIFFLKEKLKPIQYIGIIISVIGIIAIAKGEYNGIYFDFGVIYNLIAALSGAIYVVLQKPLLRKFNPIELTTYSIWAGTLFMLIFSSQLFHDIQHAPAAATLSVIYLGIFPAALGYVCWSYVLANLPASKASAFLYALPIVATLMGWLILSEVPPPISLIGGIVALLGAIMVNVRRSLGSSSSVVEGSPAVRIEPIRGDPPRYSG
jgi:drug/metabolite transporter (DMT)-like permease